MDTMEITKIVGAACGALLIYLMINWAGESLYHVGAEAHASGEMASGYDIQVADTGSSASKADTGPTFEELYAAADPAKGEKIFSKCKACHHIEDGVNGTGPSLYGVVGRPVGTEAGFTYSDTLQNLGGNWEPARLNEFLSSPKDYAPGTKMGFAGLKKPEDRANIIAYLASVPK